MGRINLGRLKAAMTAAGLDQSGLAAKVGCTPGAINQIVTGRTRRSRLLPDIARTLGVSLAWLRGETDDPAPEGSIGLTPDEATLIEGFRHLSGEGRAAVLQLISAMIAGERRAPKGRKKPDTSPTVHDHIFGFRVEE